MGGVRADEHVACGSRTDRSGGARDCLGTGQRCYDAIRWGPWRKAGYRRPGSPSPGGTGAVYWLQSSRRYGLRYPVSVEKILDAEEGRRLAYT